MISKQSYSVRALNFTDTSACGDDLKKSIVNIGKFSTNDYSFRTELKSDVAAKSENDLYKKLNEFEFNNPLMLACAIGAQMKRYELRYILTGISFVEAYLRKCDQMNTLLAIMYDLSKYGLSDKLVKNIFNFASEYINLKFDFTQINNDNTTEFENNVIVDTSETGFTFDESELIYNKKSGIGNIIKIQYPLLTCYNNKRKNIGDEKPKYFDKCKNNKIKFMKNGACWAYNFGLPGCPHTAPCKDTTAAHLTTHYCGICDVDVKHELMNCPLIRCILYPSYYVADNWRSINYYIKDSTGNNTNKYKGKGSRGRGGRKGTTPTTHNIANNNNNNQFGVPNNLYDQRNDQQVDHNRNQNDGYNNYGQSNYDQRGNNTDYNHDYNHNHNNNYNNNRNYRGNRRGGRPRR